ncbi:MAG: family 43 glycosylhydrolase [Oscillospiraceae bacterium]|nr:family 43 glycosylhydrolase [Oscillospiraceae bacterium]
MPNPYLPFWEYIPDGEPRVFGERVYIYGSHDSAGSDKFCDSKLKVWSASVDDLNNWVCHGDIFHTKADRDHPSDADWTNDISDLYAPDVVEKDGKYYLYAYIKETAGCVAISERPEGPFKLLSKYTYNVPDGIPEGKGDGGLFIDPGTLVDDDGRVYVYCGFLKSFMAELNPDNMFEVINGSFIDNIIPVEEPFSFFEACSPRKVGDTYYMIYSPTPNNPGCSKLVYATSKSPRGPFEYKGVIVDNGADYPGGNNHGSICKIKDQWYIFYHRMTNGTIMSRRACVERIQMLDDGSIPQVEMTSLGFEESLNPYKITPAETACVLTGGRVLITEKNIFTRVITNITHGAVMGYRYFDFGEDFSSKTMEFCAEIKGAGCDAGIRIVLDEPENGEEIGVCKTSKDDGVYSAVVKAITGRRAVYLIAEDYYGGGFKEMLDGRNLFELVSFVFIK